MFFFHIRRDLNSSSPPSSHLGWMESTSSLEKSTKAWTLSRPLKLKDLPAERPVAASPLPRVVNAKSLLRFRRIDATSLKLTMKEDKM
jgi:hypothetical protein